jgi:hypothetical protein
MAAFSGNHSKCALASCFRHMTPAALAVVLAGSLASPIAAQAPPSSQIPEKIQPPLSPPPKNGGKEEFKREDGVIRPPSKIDPEMEAKPRDGSRTPVIPPPGTPGGDENVHPK